MDEPCCPANAHRDSAAATSEPQRSEVVFFETDGHLRKLKDIEADVICLAVSVYGGRLREVARRFRIGRSTLYRKLRELGLDKVVGAARTSNK
jgi:DNA-binding NtrC family response regulator